MPIYEYACRHCEHNMDVLQKMSDEDLLDCPECGEPKLRRLISAPNFRLKGGGWYETDFKKDKQRNVHKSDSDSSSSTKKDGADKKPSSESKSGSESGSKASRDSGSKAGSESSSKSGSKASGD